jgi:hypothetical protein
MLIMLVNEWANTNEQLIIAAGLFVLSCIFSWFAAFQMMWREDEETSWQQARIEDAKLVRYSNHPSRRG